MKKNVRIITPVLKYWGFDAHPFDDVILKDGGLQLFVDREDQLHRLHNAISGRLCGIYGTQGAGKSSFLRKFESIMQNDGLSVIYVHLMGTSEKALYREILHVLLQSLITGEIKTSSRLKIKLTEELDRVKSSIKITKESELGAQSIIKAGIKEVREKNLTSHTEESAKALIRSIIQNTEFPFLVIIDDLERMKHFLDDEKAYFRFVTSFARTMDESFCSEKVCFIASVDNYFVNKLNKHSPDDEGAISFSFGELIELKSFDPPVLADVIRNRLKNRGWKRSVKEFISYDAFLTLVTVSGGHPRRSFAVLRSAMEFVEMNKRRLLLDKEAILAGFDTRKEIYNQKDIDIAAYLYKYKTISTSDEKVLLALDIPRSTLMNRLKELSNRLHLSVVEEPTGKTTKFIYSFPAVSLD